MMGDDVKPVFQKPADDYEARGRLDPAGFERHVSFSTYPPPAAADPFIEHFWSVRWDGALGSYYSDEVMHRPHVDIFLSEQQAGIQGTFRGKRTYSATGSGRVIGIRFRPGAFHAFWDGELASLQDKVVDLQQIFPWADQSCLGLLALDDEAALNALLDVVSPELPPPDDTIELIGEIIAAVESDEDLQTVTAVAKAFGRSERWLQQVFRDYLGIGLKWLLQRQRLLAAARQIRETDQPDWAAIAYDLGYSSQQHFITAFRQVLGSTPVQYKKGLGGR